MEKNTKKESKLCFILHGISSLLFLATGISILVENGITAWSGITNIALGVTFGSLAVIYFKKYKSAE